MPTRLNRATYAALVIEDKEWLADQPKSLERDHIKEILDKAVGYEYGPESVPQLKSVIDCYKEEVIEASERIQALEKHNASMATKILLLRRQLRLMKIEPEA